MHIKFVDTAADLVEKCETLKRAQDTQEMHSYLLKIHS